MGDTVTLTKPVETGGRKKTPEKAQFIKRNLKKDVSDGSGGVEKSKTSQKDYRSEFDKLTKAAPYSRFPDKLKASLAEPVEKALTGTDEAAKISALSDFGKAVQTAAKAETDWKMAGASVTVAEARVKHLERWQSSTAVAMRGRYDAMVVKGREGGYAEASKELSALIKDANGAVERNYDAARKKLAQSEADAKKLADDPGYLKTLRETYLASAKVADDAAGKQDFMQARNALPKLQTDAEAAVTGAQRAVTEASVTTTCTDIRNSLDTQIKFRRKGDILKKKTDVRDAVGSKEWKAAVTKIINTELPKEYMDEFNKKNDEVIDKLSKSAVIKEAFKNWDSWKADFEKNKVKISAAMQEVLTVQAGVLGIPAPTAAPYDKNDGNLGGYNGETYPPGELEVNFHYPNGTEFRELMDTLTHENTHAYQEKLIRDFRAKTIKPGDSDYAAAMILDMNDTQGDTQGYIQADDKRSYDKTLSVNAYKVQPCEKQAWAAGGKISRELVNKLEGTK